MTGMAMYGGLNQAKSEELVLVSFDTFDFNISFTAQTFLILLRKDFSGFVNGESSI